MKSSGNVFTTPRVLALLLAVAAPLGGWYAFSRNGSAAGDEYREITVTRGDLELTVLSPGVVEPENRLEIKPPIAGRIEEVLVDEGAAVKRGQILAWMSSTERAALLDAARARGPEEVQRWEEFYKPTPIIAPIDGTVILRSVEPGQTFANQDAVLVMSDRLIVKAQVDETDIAQVRLGQSAEITLDAYPEELIPGQVRQIAFDAKTVNNVTTYTVDVLPGAVPEHMRSGMTANVIFAAARRTAALLIPTEALRSQPGHVYVLKKSPAGTSPIEVEIQTGASDGKLVEVLSGLAEQDRVLVPQPKAAAARATSPFLPFGTRR